MKYTYSSNATDFENDSIHYLFDWDDRTTVTFGPIISGEICEMSHSWDKTGTYNIKVCAIDTYGNESEWSDP